MAKKFSLYQKAIRSISYGTLLSLVSMNIQVPSQQKWYSENSQYGSSEFYSSPWLIDKSFTPHPPTPSPLMGEGEPELSLKGKAPLPLWERGWGEGHSSFVSQSDSSSLAAKDSEKFGVATSIENGQEHGNKLAAFCGNDSSVRYTVDNDNSGIAEKERDNLIYGQGSVPWLQVDGPWIKDEQGQKVKLRGVSLCSIYWQDPSEWIPRAVNGQRGWHANVVRLPVTAEYAEKNDPSLRKAFRKVDEAVQICIKEKVYCIIDWHPIDKWDKSHPLLEKFWKEVAPKYKDVSNIMFEIFNEPTRPGGYNRFEDWRETAQPWVDLVRQQAPRNIIIIGSPGYSTSTHMAVRYPFQGNNLVYTYHYYPSDGDPKISYRERTIGQASKRIPIFITEVGWDTYDHFKGTTSEFGIQVKRFLNEHPQINWTAWAFDYNCGPRMLEEDLKPRGGNRYMGKFIRQWIAEENR